MLQAAALPSYLTNPCLTSEFHCKPVPGLWYLQKGLILVITHLVVEDTTFLASILN